MVALPGLARTLKVALLLGASVLLAACTGAAPTTEAPTTEAPKTEASPTAKDEGKPKYGGILTAVETLTLDQVHIDAHLSRGSPAISVHGNIHGYILAEDMQNRGTITGDLATSWQSSPDGLTWTFTIRDGLQTHKGKPFSAEDIAYNINRTIQRPNKLNLFRTGCMKTLAKEAKAPDKTTVVVTLLDRSPAFLACVSDPHMFMQPKYILEDIDGPGKGRPMRPEEIDGVGPFQFVATAERSHWELKRSASFFKQGLPYLDGLRFVDLPDASSKIAAFRTQRIDMFQKFATTPRPSEAKALKAEFGDKITLQPGVAPSGPPFQLNWKRPPLDDIRVREA
ncbi:MAG: ABC transporter substrate-binding protein, partial [Chloroflexi bacterium]|nr:ABC transporter substrate-binding protein [Chloroflexota bacterium]